MRIAFVHPRYPSSEGTGATHSATLTVSGLSDAGHDVDVYCPRLPDVESDLDLHHLAGNSRHPHTATRLNREVTARLDEFRTYDVVHSYLPRLLPSLARVGSRSSVGTVVTLNAYGGTCAKNDLLYRNREKCHSKSKRKCLRCVLGSGVGESGANYPYQTASQLFSLGLTVAGDRRLGNVDAFRAPSEHVKANHVAHGYPAGPIHVIPHPLDDQFDVQHTSEFTEPYRLLYVGSLETHKGVDKLVPLAAALSDEALEFSITVVGSGGLEETVRSRAEKLGVAAEMEFTGFVPYGDLPELYAAHDCFVYPGIWDEPLGRVYLEALATGTPIVTTEYGSIEAIVGDAGRVTDGSVTGFRDTILDVVEANALPEMSAAAKERSKQFRLPRFIERLERLYDDVSPERSHR